MSQGSIWGDQRGRLLKQKWSGDLQLFAEELYDMIGTDPEIVTSNPITVIQNGTDPAVHVIQNGGAGGSTPITVTDPAGVTSPISGGSGGGDGTWTDTPPSGTDPAPPTTPLQAYGRSFTTSGQVLGGSAGVYSVSTLLAGTVTGQALNVLNEETLDVGTWVTVDAVATSGVSGVSFRYFILATVWLPHSEA